jgi:hypothetical protein
LLTRRRSKTWACLTANQLSGNDSPRFPVKPRAHLMGIQSLGLRAEFDWSRREADTGSAASNWSLSAYPSVPRLFVMEVETLGVARSLGWKVHMRCATGYREGTRSMRRCVYRKQLDLETLGLHARAELSDLKAVESRLMCPACGNRRVTVVFERGRLRWEQRPITSRSRSRRLMFVLLIL